MVREAERFIFENMVWILLHIKSPAFTGDGYARLFVLQKWSRRESNPCPKTNSLFFYYHSLFFFIPSALRKQTSSEFQ